MTDLMPPDQIEALLDDVRLKQVRSWQQLYNALRTALAAHEWRARARKLELGILNAAADEVEGVAEPSEALVEAAWKAFCHTVETVGPLEKPALRAALAAASDWKDKRIAELERMLAQFKGGEAYQCQRTIDWEKESACLQAKVEELQKKLDFQQERRAYFAEQRAYYSGQAADLQAKVEELTRAEAYQCQRAIDWENQAARLREAIGSALDNLQPSSLTGRTYTGGAIATLRAALSSAPPSPGPRGIRPEVLAFAYLMERELRANDHKPGWKTDDADALARRVLEEAAELKEATLFANAYAPVKPEDRAKVAEEAADVANMAMMVADVCGCLDAPPLPAAESELRLLAKQSRR